MSDNQITGAVPSKAQIEEAIDVLARQVAYTSVLSLEEARHAVRYMTLTMVPQWASLGLMQSDWNRQQGRFRVFP